MNKISINDYFDVVVVGGGSAGVTAAIQSGRAGAKTLLVEKNGMLGGTTTVGGVNFPGLFHAWGKQIVKGIGWELLSKTMEITGKDFPDFKNLVNDRHWKSQVLIDIGVYATLCDELVLQSGVTPLYHTMIAKIEEPKDAFKKITLCTKSGLLPINCNVLIDCSADANCATIAGHEVIIQQEFQPATLVAEASGYNLDDIDMEQLKLEVDAAVKNKQLQYTDISWNANKFSGNWVIKYGGNSNHIKSINAHNSFGKTYLEIEGRKSILRLFKFLKKQKGFENLTIKHLATECGVRETANIVGKKTVTVQDYTSGKIHDDALCFSFYPIDLHKSDQSGLDCRPLEKGKVPTIPRGAMLPINTHNFIVAGRCISSDRLANSALRTQGSCMAMGQAAGAMAALASSTNTETENLSIESIHNLLQKHDAIVPTIKSK